MANGISCIGTVKHECRSSIVVCIPEVARRNVLDASWLRRIFKVEWGKWLKRLCCTREFSDSLRV